MLRKPVQNRVNHLWKGQKTIKKLRELSKEETLVIKKWLSRQAIWQVHLPPSNRVNRPHYQVTIPNQIHQFDLLHMHRDMLYANEYKYILSGIHVDSRYKVARPIRNKQAKDVVEMSANIYKLGPLTYSKIFKWQWQSSNQVTGKA